MTHIIRYRLKMMLRNRTMMFWSVIFPVALMTLFGLVLRTSYEYTEFETVPIAIVENQAYRDNQALQSVLRDAKSGDNLMFSSKVISLEDAHKSLEKKDIAAYIVCGETFDVHVNESGINQTIVQTFFDEFLQKNNMVEQMLMQGATMEQIQSSFTSTMDYIDVNSQSNLDVTNIYFYTGLAMSAMFGAMWAVKAIGDIQANQSQKGARIAMGPTNKAVHLLGSLILNLVFVFVVLCLQFLYVYLIFDIDFGTTLPYLFLTLMVGSIAGSSLGAFIGSAITMKDVNQKVNLVSSVSMLFSFLAGMMIVQVKLIIQQFAPFINYINPVNMITDAMYCLYYFGVTQRFFFNIISLLIFSIICYGISFICLSKKSYKTLEVR